MKLFSYSNNKNAFKSLIVAEFVGKTIEVPAFVMVRASTFC